LIFVGTTPHQYYMDYLFSFLCPWLCFVCWGKYLYYIWFTQLRS